MTPSTPAAAVWAMRASAELDAAERFERLATGLARERAHPAVVELARNAAADEIRHHRRCVQLVEHFGARWRRPERVTCVPLRSGLASVRADLLYEIVSMSCVTETLSTALLVELRAEATDAQVRDVVHEILTDEVDHSRLGWAHLASEAKELDCAFLGPRLPSMLAATVDEEVFTDTPDAGALQGLGTLPRPIRRDIFAATMQDVVFPGFRTYGIDTRAAEAWLDARLG